MVTALLPSPQRAGTTDADGGAGDLNDQGDAYGQGAGVADGGSQGVDDDAPEPRCPQSQHDGMDIGTDHDGGRRVVLGEGGGRRGRDIVDVVSGVPA